jgi:L-threonylcarbamoyladenylate synthase
MELLDAAAPGALEVAAEALRAGLAVVVPTDTVYGISVDPFRPGASERLFAAKGRPRHVQLPVLVAGAEQADELAEVGDGARALMARFWPGALTIVLTRRAGPALDLGDDGSTVGVRCPDHEVARRLCAEVGPLATTSANRHGGATPATATEVADLLGDAVALVLDAGPCRGAPSTVVDCTSRDVRLLRAGGLPMESVVAELRSS